MRDDHGAAEAEQDGSAIALRVEPGGELTQAAPLQERADPGGRGPGHRGPQLSGGEPDRALEGLQGHVPGEAVGHDHVELAGQQAPALHVAGEAQRQRAVRRVGGEQLVRPPGELVALPRLRADGEQPHPRGGHAQHELGIGHSELAELHEHLRLGVRGRPGVDEHGTARTGGQHHGQPGPEHAGQRPQPQPGRGHDASGGAGRHHGGRLAAPDQLARHRDARPRAAQAGQRAFIHGQVVLGGHHAEPFGPLGLGVGAHLGQRPPQPRGGPGQQHADAVLAMRGECPGDDLVRGVISAHRVDRDHRAAAVRRRAQRVTWVGCRIRGVSFGAECMVRPLSRAASGGRPQRPGRRPAPPGGRYGK
jgi:hypothetical protein